MNDFLFPSLLELEKGIHFFSAKGSRDFQQLKECPGLWKRISVMGTFCSYFAPSTEWWTHRFLLPILLQASFHYLEKMRGGTWKRKDEDRLYVVFNFVRKEAFQKQLQAHASKDLVEFLSKEAPSFWRQRELFRSECFQLGIKAENCSWHQNEFFSQYCERMRTKLSSHALESRASRLVSSAATLKQKESLEKKRQFLFDKLLSRVKALKEKCLKTLARVSELKILVFRHKKQVFLVRVAADGLYRESLLLEHKIISLAIQLEELVTRLPDEAMLFLFESPEELERSLQQDEEAFLLVQEGMQTISSELTVETIELAKVRKNLNHILKELTHRLHAIERITHPYGMKELQEKLIEKGSRAINDCRNGLTRLPGLLFPLQQLEGYIEDIVQLCQAFLQESVKKEIGKK